MKIHSKLPDVGTTIFTVMSQLAVEHNAVNLGQGFPDFMMSEELIALVNGCHEEWVQSICSHEWFYHC